MGCNSLKTAQCRHSVFIMHNQLGCVYDRSNIFVRFTTVPTVFLSMSPTYHCEDCTSFWRRPKENERGMLCQHPVFYQGSGFLLTQALTFHLYIQQRCVQPFFLCTALTKRSHLLNPLPYKLSYLVTQFWPFLKAPLSVSICCSIIIPQRQILRLHCDRLEELKFIKGLLLSVYGMLLLAICTVKSVCCLSIKTSIKRYGRTDYVLQWQHRLENIWYWPFTKYSWVSLALH